MSTQDIELVKSLNQAMSEDLKPPMKIVDVRHAKEDGGPQTYIVATDGMRLYAAMMNAEIWLTSIPYVGPSAWTRLKGCIPPGLLLPDNFYPKGAAGYTPFEPRPGESDRAVFAKRQELVEVACQEKIQGLQDPLTVQLTMCELIMCELLRVNPHPNIAEYRGVVVQDYLKFNRLDGSQTTIKLGTARVIEIKFKRYDCTLWDLHSSHERVNPRYCLNSIANGIKHMRSLGYVHGDIKFDKIFVDSKDPRTVKHRYEFVVGDFDSAAPTGSVCELKYGTPHYAPHRRHDHDEVGDDDG